MADKRRKRKTNATSCFEDSSHSSSKEDFHAVTISDSAAAAMPRRRSEVNNSSSGSSSWMTKVTAAMSHRIFSGKKLGASRSTQVMPLAGVATGSASGQGPKHQGSSISSSSAATTAFGESTVGSVSTRRPPTLRQVSSENSLARRTTDDAAAETVVQSFTPVERVDFCPSVVCDIAPDDDEEDQDQGSEKKKKQSVIQSIHVKGSQQKQQWNNNSSDNVKVIEKIVPRGDHENSNNDDSDFEDTSSQRRTRNNTSSSATAFSSPRLAVLERESRLRDNDGSSDPTPVIQDTAPILKDFFSRNASAGQGIRVQQRESRRESLYKSSKQRQERLRRRVEEESQESQAQQRKFRAEELQKLNQQRRVHLRQEATSAHKALASRLEGDTRRFATERERWEGEFESEIQILNRAFRKASAKTAGNAGGDGDGDTTRPTTVAGLALPQALSQIRRDASNYEKRLKTAEPRASSRREWDFGSATKSQQRESAESGKCDIFFLEDAKEENEDEDEEDEGFEVLHATVEDADASRFDQHTSEPIASAMTKLTIDELLDERETLLQRIAHLEKLVGAQQIAAAATTERP